MTDQEALFVSRAALSLMGGFTWICTTEQPARIRGHVTVAAKYYPPRSDSITEIQDVSHVVGLLEGGRLRLCADVAEHPGSYAVLDILDCRAATRAALVARLMEWSTYVVGDDQ